METTQRMVPTAGGKRAGIKLDQSTWTAIEWLADKEGKTWQQWCANVIDSTPEGENTTAAVRTAAMDGLLAATIFEDRGEQLAAMQAHPLMCNSGTLNDAQLEQAMGGATVHGWSDFGGFAIGFGHDEVGQECVWVRNGLRNGLHFAFVLPEIAGSVK